ncbi:hypothetical protein QR97_18550 [Streptomyces sp. PBH53]|uniref:hypothetical protein n=1 Tax=Streptomyces TaxID=1883 RepID=UPI0006561346|nr:hypothetical protein [Streptomyces sp. PBH53]AKN71538.1 hypothetical protein QR97_18550 [Streptomyces sp. PBH53]
MTKQPRMATLRERCDGGGGVRRAGSGGDHDQDAEASRSLPAGRTALSRRRFSGFFSCPCTGVTNW